LFSYNDDAHPDNSALHIYRFVLLLLRLRRGAAGYDLGTTMKYLRCTTSGAAG
jgi:hypothetical protein